MGLISVGRYLVKRFLILIIVFIEKMKKKLIVYYVYM